MILVKLMVFKLPFLSQYTLSNNNFRRFFRYFFIVHSSSLCLSLFTVFDYDYILYYKVSSMNFRAYWNTLHPELMRERSIWFLLFEIKRVFVYNSTVFRLTDLYVNTLSFKMYMPTKKYLT